MKTRNIFVLALVAMIFLGCSKESLVDPQTEITELEMNQLNSDTKTAVKIYPFHLKGIGKFKVVEPAECRSNGQINLVAETKEIGLGNFKTIWKNCTDFRESHLINGMHIALNDVSKKGDEIYFYSDESGKDMIGNYYLIIYNGGTGRFANAKGEIKFYYQENWITNDKGTNFFEGQGRISY